MKIDLVGPWNRLLGLIPGIDTILLYVAVVGVAIVVFYFVRWIWQKRRGGGGAGGFPSWPIVIGSVLAAPKFLIPIILALAGWLASLIAGILSTVSGSL